MHSPSGLASRPPRARPLSGDDRRAMILDAAIPLFMEQGKDVTTRQIADRAGIAEGTVFRAFGDKDAIIHAAVARFLDPEPLRAALRSIDPELPLETKVRDILFHLRSKFQGVIGIMSALGMHGPPPGSHERVEGARVLAGVLESEAERLRIDPQRAAHFVRLVAFASSIGPFADAHLVTTDDLADLVLHGIATCGFAHDAAHAAAGSPATRSDSAHS